MDASLSIEELVKELDEPNLTDWKIFSQSSTLSVYRKATEKLFHYKCYSHLPDIIPEVFYKVTLDVDYRLVWDKYLKEGKLISDGNKQGVYWQVVMPLFMDNRDYTFMRENGEYDIGDRHFYYALTRSEQFTDEPPRRKVVRIETCQSQVLICSDGANGLKSIFVYYEDPRGSFPAAVWSWVAKFGIPIYAKLTYNACKTYPEWVKDKKTVLPDVTEHDGIDSAAATAAAAALMMPTNTGVGNDDEKDKE